MATFNELMQKMVNTDYEDLVELAKEAVDRLMPHCKAVDTEYDGFFMLTALILSSIGADGALTGLEKKMLSDTMGLEEDTIQKLISMYDSRMVELADHFADNMGDDVKADALMLVTAFAAVDEKISKEETGLIKKLMA